MIPDILVLIDGAEGASAVGDCAIRIAEAHSSYLTIVGMPRDPGHVMHLAQAPARVLADALHHAQDAAEAMARRIETTARARSIGCTHQTIETPAADYPELVMRIARRFDLCILALPRFDSHSEDEKLFEAPLFNSGRPVLGVPRTYAATKPFQRIVVAWDGEREAARAVGDAMPLLRKAGHVEIVSIAGGRSQIDEEMPGCNIAGHLARHGVGCEFLRLEGKAPVARLLLDQAERSHADLIVMGAYRHSRWRQAVLGGATRDIMQGTKVPILMAR